MKVWAAERISHSHWSLSDRAASQGLCVTFITAGHWGSLLTFDPSLDHLTLAWPICLAPTAEQRVSLAQAAEWWFSSLLLAKCLNLRRQHTTGLDGMSQQGRTTWPSCADTTFVSTRGLWDTNQFQTIFQFIAVDETLTVMLFIFWHLKCPSMWLSRQLIQIKSRLTSLSAGFVTDILAKTTEDNTHLPIALTSASNWPKTWAKALIGCWPCSYEQKGQLALNRAACSAAHG